MTSTLNENKYIPTITRPMRTIIGKVILLLAGFLISFLLLEIALRLMSPEFLTIHPPGLYTADPEVGYVLTSDFRGNFVHSEFETQLSINQDGLRGQPIRPLSTNSVRILVLGDSQTWGFGVEDDETYATILEEQLAQQFPDLDIQVLNGGVPGYGTARSAQLAESSSGHLATRHSNRTVSFSE